MLSIRDLEARLGAVYSPVLNSVALERRKSNIEAFTQLVGHAIQENTLLYSQTEERLELFYTQHGECICIQYPGRESANSGDKMRRYDFRPKIISRDGELIRDMAFVDMWSVVEKINIRHHDILNSLAALFFRLGRMLDHVETAGTYNTKLIAMDGSISQGVPRQLRWNMLVLDEDVIESLNYNIGEIQIDDGNMISFEAFIYFFDLLMQNEDCKYYDKKGDYSSGRITTSDSMLLLSSYLNGKTALATLLQRYVSGFGVAKCKTSEIQPATGGLIKLIDRKKDIKRELENSGVRYVSSGCITLNGIKIDIAIKVPAFRIAFLSSSTSENVALLRASGWTTYTFEELVPQDVFDAAVRLFA